MFLLDKIWWKGLNKLVAVERAGEETEYAVMLAKKQKGGLAVEQKTIIKAPELHNWLKQAGRAGIIWIAREEETVSGWTRENDKPAIVNELLGAATDRFQDFVVEVWPGESKNYAGLMRTEILEKAQSVLGKYAENLIGFSLTPMAIGPLLPQLVPESETVIIQSGGENLGFINGRPSQETEGMKISSEELAARLNIEPRFLRHYAGILSIWLKPEEKPDSEKLAESKKAFLAVSRLLRIASVATVLLLALSLGTFGARQFAQKKMNRLRAEYSAQLPILDQLKKQEDNIAEKAALLDQFAAQTLRGSQVSRLADQVGTMVPEAVSLEKMIFFPGEEDVERLRIEEPENIDLIIAGTSEQAHPIPAFSARLQTLDFVQKLEVSRSDFNFTKDQFEFLFLISLKNAG